jgi:carbon starvation protein
MLAGGILGLVFMRPEIQLPAFTSFRIGNNFMFPILFITVACGAISGFHSLVGSGTTSKQLDNESDIRLIGYGGMLIEGVLATLAILSAAYISQGRLTELMGAGGALNVFADGLGTFIASMGVSFSIAKTFVTLSISAFALTTLDTATRLARFIFQEFFEVEASSKAVTSNLTNLMGDKFVATTVTVVISGALAFNGWKAIWPLFGSANQLLAALTLLTLALWLKKTGKNYTMAVIPIIFMFTVTLLALILLMFANLSNPVLLFFPIALFILAIILIFEARKALSPDLLASKENLE